MKIEVKAIVARLINSWTFDDIPQSTEEQMFPSRERAVKSLLEQGYSRECIDIDDETDELGQHKWGWMFEEGVIEFNTEQDPESDKHGYEARVTEKHQTFGTDIVKCWGKW